MTVEYSRLNYFRLAQPPHHGRGPNTVVQVETDSVYPFASTTNQRRRPWRLNGHRGVGAKSVEIKRKLPPDDKGHRAEQPVGIWRGLDKRLVREYNSKYTGAELRRIRAIKGVGRPWLTLIAA